ncbi:MAG: tRNA (adenosine(37)-N6)-threonylcarbamoyltransferase complex dimerization subunit type 1 TsaB [Spirochaetaceae bacterium 4572_59]|nr:MAG: tRNA (adenosine(37)-N6)-threonylcarbamoyltransferase complex dimerization subunit type 1 TsaB [Spirochaetaceae bacterium 4572_59]
MKNVLAIDCATQLLSICLKSEDNYYEATLDCGLKHSENLLKTVEMLINTAGIEKKELELLICSEGPGSFTGLRIAMSTIKGMATGLNIPYTYIPTLDYLSWGYDYFEGAVVPVIDAKKKCFYCAVYEKGKKLSKDMDITEDNLFTFLKSYKKVLFTGPDCMKIKEDFRSGIYKDLNYFSGKSRQLLMLGLEEYKQSGAKPIGTGPVYLRKSEAEIAMFGE